MRSATTAVTVYRAALRCLGIFCTKIIADFWQAKTPVYSKKEIKKAQYIV
jgi:hypothetical protein